MRNYNTSGCGTFYMNRIVGSPGVGTSRLLDFVNNVTAGIHKTISDNIDVIAGGLGPAVDITRFITSLEKATDHDRLTYIVQSVEHLQNAGVVRKEEQTWVSDLFKGDYMENLSNSPKLVSMLALVAASYNIMDDTNPIIQLRLKLAGEYNDGNTVHLDLIDSQRDKLNSLKTILKENGRNTRQRKATIASRWIEVINIYVELKKEILKNSFEKTIWLKDEKAKIDSDPKLRAGVRDLVEDIEDLIRFTDELPAEVLEVFRKLI